MKLYHFTISENFLFLIHLRGLEPSIHRQRTHPARWIGRPWVSRWCGYRVFQHELRPTSCFPETSCILTSRFLIGSLDVHSEPHGPPNIVSPTLHSIR